MNPRPLPAIRPESSPSYLRRASPPPMPAAPEDESGPDWRRIWSALLRFKWVVLLMVLVGLGGAFAATRVLRPIYRAQANVWVDVPGRRHARVLADDAARRGAGARRAAGRAHGF